MSQDASLVFFWVLNVICVLLGILSIIGNGLVIYAAKQKQDFGPLRQLNHVVINLAITDALFGLIGIPLTMVFWYWGKIYDRTSKKI